jgi:hypothetical protein
MDDERLLDPDFLKDQRHKTIKELATLKQMVYNWKNSYLRQLIEYEADDLGDAESWYFLCHELMYEVEIHMYPYIQRFKDLKYITAKETSEYTSEINSIVEELKQEIPKVLEQKERDRKIKEGAQKDMATQLADMKEKYEKLLARLEALEGE